MATLDHGSDTHFSFSVTLVFHYLEQLFDRAHGVCKDSHVDYRT